MKTTSFSIPFLIFFIFISANLFAQHDGPSLKEPKVSSAKEALDLGRSFLKREDYTMAKVLFNKAIALDPKNSEAFSLLADCLSTGSVSEEVGKEVIKNYETAIELNSQNHLALNNLGTFYFSRGNLLKAEENYKKAIQIKPDDGVYYFCLANVDMMQNRLPEAKENLIKGLKNEPDDFLATKDLVEVLFQMKKYREAIPFFKRMIKLGKGNPELSKIIAEKLDALGKTRRADVFRDLANENPSAKENEVKDE